MGVRLLCVVVWGKVFKGLAYHTLNGAKQTNFRMAMNIP